MRSARLTMTQTTPREVMQRPDGLSLVWADEHRTDYAFPELRRICRCAACAGEPDKPLGGPVRLPIAPPTGSFEPASLELVGNYAVGISWRDAHRSILPFEALRGHCPCAECQSQREAAARDGT